MSGLPPAPKIGVWGASGSGKSSWVKKTIASKRRVVVFDPLGEYRGFVRVTTPDQVRQAMRADWAGFRIAYTPARAGGEPDKLSKLCNGLLKAQKPYQLSEGKFGAQIILVVEEMNLCFPVHGGETKCPGFAEICSRGRHSGIPIIGVSQRIAEVSTRFRGNCDKSVVFRQKGPRDRAAAMAEIGCGLDFLPKQNLDYVTEEGGKIDRGTLTFPAKNRGNRRKSQDA